MEITERNEWREMLVIAKKVNASDLEITTAFQAQIEGIFQVYASSLKNVGEIVAGSSCFAANEKYRLIERILLISQRLTALPQSIFVQDFSEWIELIGELLDDLDEKDAEIAKLKNAAENMG